MCSNDINTLNSGASVQVYVYFNEWSAQVLILRLADVRAQFDRSNHWNLTLHLRRLETGIILQGQEINASSNHSTATISRYEDLWVVPETPTVEFPLFSLDDLAVCTPPVSDMDTLTLYGFEKGGKTPKPANNTTIDNPDFNFSDLDPINELSCDLQQLINATTGVTGPAESQQLFPDLLGDSTLNEPTCEDKRTIEESLSLLTGEHMPQFVNLEFPIDAQGLPVLEVSFQPIDCWAWLCVPVCDCGGVSVCGGRGSRDCGRDWPMFQHKRKAAFPNVGNSITKIRRAYLYNHNGNICPSQMHLYWNDPSSFRNFERPERRPMN